MQTTQALLLIVAAASFFGALLGGGTLAYSPPPSPCAKMSGTCIARTHPGLGECRTEAHVAAGKAVTFVSAHPHLTERFENSAHAYLLCAEPYSCCIEDPCESVLSGTCQDSGIPAPDGHKYYSGFCPPPKYANHVMCLARDY